MQLNSISPKELHAEWVTHEDITSLEFLSDAPEELCHAAGVHQCINLNHAPIINEATYKEIASLIDGNFLSQKVRADVLNGIRLDTFEDNIMRFRINSSEYQSNRIQYQCSVMFDEWDEFAQDPELNFAEKARMLLWIGNIRLHCTCPSFLYWGYQYLLSALDAAIYPEERKPEVRNPSERGIVCKHLNRILRVLPFYSGDIAGALKRQFGQS